jgi:hypothetical protein
MSAKLRLERKVRWTLALIIVLALSLPLLAVRSYIASVGERTVHTGDSSADERLVAIDGHLMLVDPNHLGPLMSAWAKSDKQETLSFELSDRSFVPNSVVPSPITETRVHQLVQVAKTNPMLMVHIILPTHFASRVAQQLDEQRATRLRSELLADGLSTPHVNVGGEQQDFPNGKAELVILLSKETGVP